jgi:uncharacterized OsmC-like protein
VTDPDLDAVFRRKAAAVARHPGHARATAHARARLDGSGLACEISRDGRAVLRADHPASEGEGGVDAGPPPWLLVAAGLAADLAMGYRLWGARLGVAIRGAEVGVLCEWDLRGQMGLAPEVPVGWDCVLFDVTIDSAAPEADVRRVVETANRLSPMLANLAPAIRRLHRLSISSISSRSSRG